MLFTTMILNLTINMTKLYVICQMPLDYTKINIVSVCGQTDCNFLISLSFNINFIFHRHNLSTQMGLTLNVALVFPFSKMNF